MADGITLYNADCREVLPTLPKVDACVTDPPYGIGGSNKKNMSRGTLADPKDYGDYDWDAEPADADAIALMLACSKWQIIFGGNYFEGLGPTSCWLVWDKKNGTNDFADCELAWTNLKSAVRRIEWLWNGMIRKGDDVREHPTQKPEGVMSWCLTQLPDDVRHVLDPYMGSGTTGVAAVKRGLHFTGIERHPKYFSIACRRISDELKRPQLPLQERKPAVQEALL